ncbi:MAG: TnsD family Tn7-like transposition protein [Clostridium sp.]|uniref:TnsD family Tn7-like transposition protein n=1 Tax=Clostridium sp. TaxID=1506 RepID=UPI0029042BD0|nr:TnsD family Tn7-like transposition protein [Clostridium sp.]MDU1180587.1 TnsD family Tn7-like transposition protein [Clostridium sp.]MDU1227916.1 TnsD family Tn7-like transposition protein [Clostridium sp.]MDU7653895.1 TnsD family Tn7-like transposition protein [Clostridium sp.]
MISFFPTAYKDEILYSLINRYHMRSGNVSYSDTIKDLYNNRYTKSILDLPNSNKELLDNINLGFQLDEFIKQTSLVRYYTAFLDKEKIENLINQLSDSGCRGIHSIVGASQRISRYYGYLKICPQCYQEEVNQLGEGYFHRSHQIPAVFVCGKHRCVLKKSKKSFSFYSNRFISLDEMNFVDFDEVKVIKENIDMFISIANDCEFLLNNDIDNKKIEWFRNQYKNRLKQLNLCTLKGVVNINEVKVKFNSFYGQDILQLFSLNIYSDDDSNWIKYIIRNKRYVLNPLKHIMFIKFLGIDIREIFSTNIEYKPFGNGPLTCMNKVCDNYRKRVIDEVEISYNSKKKRPVGRFKCECGYTYCRIGPDKSE